MAQLFGVAVSSVVKWSQRHRATGCVAPAKMGGYRKPTLEAHKDFIVERIEQTPHLTLHGLKDELLARGVKVSHNAVGLLLRREGLTFKKTLFALEQARADVARRRRRWRSWQDRLDPRVFIDETWIKTNMAPLRGWGAKGKRLRGFAPHGHWRTLTFVGALRHDRLAAPCVFDGPINGEWAVRMMAQIASVARRAGGSLVRPLSRTALKKILGSARARPFRLYTVS